MMVRVMTVFAAWLFVVTACSSSDSPEPEMTGGSAEGGASAGSGGSPTGSGGAPALGSGGEGSTNSGGTPASGGMNAGGTAGSAGSGGKGGTTPVGGSAGMLAGGAGGVPPNCGALAFCEGFERNAAGALGGSELAIEGGSDADYSVTNEQKHSGANAVKVKTTGELRMLKLSNVNTKTAGGKSVFARVWMFFPELPVVSRADGPQPHYRLARFFGLAPNSASDPRLVGVIASAGIVGNNRGRMLFIKESTKKDCAADGATLPANKWTCVEFRSDGAGFEGWIDGNSMGARAGTVGDACWQKYDHVLTAAFGFQIAAAALDKPLTFFMDDIAVDEKRIGCN